MSAGPARPAPTRDLDDQAEIAEMVRRFYQDVAQDDLLGPMFNDVAAVDWAEHLPKLTQFWCRALLGIEGYQGNPFRAHAAINDRSPFTPAHFERWLQLFGDTLELGWVGPNTERALALARNVAAVHSSQLVGRLTCRSPAVTADLGGEAPCLLGVVDDHRDIQRRFRRPSGPRHTGRDPRPRDPLLPRDRLRRPAGTGLRRGRRGRLDDPHPEPHRLLVLDRARHHRYRGAVTATHRHLHSRQALTPAHCDRWCQLWCSTIDDSWAGPCAEKAKTHAAALMAGMAKHVFGFECH